MARKGYKKPKAPKLNASDASWDRYKKALAEYKKKEAKREQRRKLSGR